MPGIDNGRLSGVLAPITPENCAVDVPEGAGGIEVRQIFLRPEKKALR